MRGFRFGFRHHHCHHHHRHYRHDWGYDGWGYYRGWDGDAYDGAGWGYVD